MSRSWPNWRAVASAARIRAVPIPLAPQRPDHLQMAEFGHTGKVPADLGVVGRLPRQEPVADRAAVQPGHQQHPATVLLAGQVVGEVMTLPEDRDERLKVGVGP